MTKRKTDLIPVSFKLAPEQVRQMSLLSVFHGGRTRVLVVALDRLYQATLAENPAFAELAAAGLDTTDATPPADE
jgi:hypothetical protein